MRLIDADAIRYDQLLKIGNREHPLVWAVSRPVIDAMPTIEAEPKHGRWIDKTEDIDFGKGYLTKHTIVCSECGEEAFFDLDCAYIETNYCPNCGAKMDGGEDG